MEGSDFEKWLRQGLGRAATFIRTENPARYRDALLHACTRNLCYDRQCEDTRGYYLANLVQMSADKKFFRDGILAALTSQTDEFGGDDVLQMFALARHWASEGDEVVRQTLYDVFARDALGRAEIWCADYLVKLDGLKALLFVLQFFGKVEEDDRPRRFESLVAELEERDGKEAVAKALNAAAAERADLRQLLERVRAEEDDRERAQLEWESQPRPSYASVKRGITGQESRMSSLENWGKDATDDELRSAANDLLAEDDDNRLQNYLRIFYHRSFPGPHGRLIDLVKTGSRRLAHFATRALAKVDDRNLRVFALELMGAPDRRDLAVRLLAGRSDPGDYTLLEQALQQPMSDDAYHRLGLAAKHLWKANPGEDAVGSMKLLYENGPCSMCRQSCVKHLITLDRLPGWMREECHHDADSDIRELVADDMDKNS